MKFLQNVETSLNYCEFRSFRTQGPNVALANGLIGVSGAENIKPVNFKNSTLFL